MLHDGLVVPFSKLEDVPFELLNGTNSFPDILSPHLPFSPANAGEKGPGVEGEMPRLASTLKIRNPY